MDMQTKPQGQWLGHDVTWWIGQVTALLLMLSLLTGGYGGPVAAAVGYALMVLVDIREALAKWPTIQVTMRKSDEQ